MPKRKLRKSGSGCWQLPSEARFGRAVYACRELPAQADLEGAKIIPAPSTRSCPAGTGGGKRLAQDQQAHITRVADRASVLPRLTAFAIWNHLPAGRTLGLAASRAASAAPEAAASAAKAAPNSGTTEPPETSRYRWSRSGGSPCSNATA